MDIVTLGAALNGSAEYVNSHFKGGSNIQIVDNPDGTQTINASGEVSAEDTVARADIAAIKDGETLDSFGDVETALATKANTATTYTKTEVDTALDNKVDKETGKGLSTNDYTTAEKTKLAGIAEGAEVNEIESIKVNNTTINPDANKVVNITVPTTAADVSALPDTTKYAAALSLTINSSTYVMTGQLKDQNGDNLGTAQTIDLPLESVVVGGSYNNQTKKVVLTLQNGNTIEFSVADLVSGLQTELSVSNKLNPAYINYDSTHRAVSDTEKSTWNGKQNALTTAQLAAANSGIDSTKVEQIETNKANISSLDTEIDTVANLGAKNLIDFNQWASNVPVYNGTKSYSNGVMTVTATGSGCVTYHNQYFPEVLKIPVKEGEKYTITWDTTVTTNIGFFQLCPNGNAISGTDVSIASKQVEYTVASGVTYLTYRVGVWASGNSINISKLMLRPATISDPTYQPYARSNSELTALSAEDRASLVELVDSGAKNLSDWDGGAAATDSSFVVQNEPITLKKATYAISFDTTANSGRCEIVFRDSNGVVGSYTFDNTSSSTLSAEITLTADAVKFNIFTTKAATITNFMICTKAAWGISQAYQPYRPPYQELYEKVETNENNILYNIKDGVQNIFQLASGTRIVGGVTFTINADGTITLSNTATSDAVFIISEKLSLSDDTYVLYGDGFIPGIFMDTYDSGYTNRRTFTTYAVTNSNTKIWRLIVNSGTNTNGVTIRPMMCLKSLYDANPTYQPYALSNAELTAAIQALQAQLANLANQ